MVLFLKKGSHIIADWPHLCSPGLNNQTHSRQWDSGTGARHQATAFWCFPEHRWHGREDNQRAGAAYVKGPLGLTSSCEFGLLLGQIRKSPFTASHVPIEALGWREVGIHFS